MLLLYANTLIETDFSFLPSETAGAVTWVKAVPDPPVSVLPVGVWVVELIIGLKNRKKLIITLSLVCCYYFQKSDELLLAIKEQMQRHISLNNEFFLADTVNIRLEHGMKMRVERADIWLDAGMPADVLNSNRY